MASMFNTAYDNPKYVGGYIMGKYLSIDKQTDYK